MLREIAGAAVDPRDGLNNGESNHLREVLSGLQKRYLRIREIESSAAIVAAANAGPRRPPRDVIGDIFGRDSYDRVRGLAEGIRLGACRRIVMVGSGAFPASLLWLHDHCPEASLLGIDVDPDCVTRAERLAAALGLDRIAFAVADGAAFNYAGADFVYIANHVAPKAAVVAAAALAPSVLQIAVREPTDRGRLLAEAARDALPQAFAVTGSGPESGAFLSYDLFLSRTGTAAANEMVARG